MDESKRCAACKMDIHLEATRCPHCRERQPGAEPMHRGGPERVVGGVCTALARQLGLDVALVRVAFVLALAMTLALIAFLVVAVGLVAGVLCALAVGLKYKLGYDDSLDVVGVHLVGGLVGCLLIGLLATDGGLLYGDGLDLLGKQAIAVGAVLAYSFVVTLVIGKLIDMTVGFRVSEEEEVTGIDSAEHLETGYDFTSLSGGVRSLVGAAASTPVKPREGADA